MQTPMHGTQEPKPTRTAEEKKKLIDDMISGDTRCYFCDVVIDQDADDTSTEYGIFWACGRCFPKWGNPDQDILNGAEADNKAA
jgi:hypothetical protein